MRPTLIARLRVSSRRFTVGAALLISLGTAVLADDVCQGHQLLSDPRPATSCQNVAPQVFASPDRQLSALIVPAGVSLYATPDIESRVVIRSGKGDTLTSKDYSSPRGTNGYYVYQAKWSPDSQFFVFTMVSSGGHSPWQFPTWVYSREKNQFANLSDMIDGRPTVSGDFLIGAPHTLTVSTWRQQGDLQHSVPVTVNLGAAFAKLPPSAN